MNSHSSKRKEKLLEFIHEKKSITIKELSQHFDTSTPTLYRDLKSLEEDRVIQKFYGGVKLIEKGKEEHEFFYRTEINVEKKKHIAKKALQFINSGDNVFIDASTTCFYLCKELSNSAIDYLTIFTNGLFVPIEFLSISNFKMVNFGGFLDRDVTSFVKNEPQFFLENIKYLKYFGSTYAFSYEYGAMDNLDLWEIEVKKKVLQFADEVFLLIDSSKFNLKGTYNWLEVDKVKKIITDPAVDKKIVDLLSLKGVGVFY